MTDETLSELSYSKSEWAAICERLKQTGYARLAHWLSVESDMNYSENPAMLLTHAELKIITNAAASSALSEQGETSE